MQMMTARLLPCVKILTPLQLKLYQSQLIVVDVRSWLEYLMGHIPGAQRMNRDRVLQEISKHQQIVMTCRSGNLSFPVAKWLVKQGYQNVYNLQGGCIAWQKLGYPLQKGNKSLRISQDSCLSFEKRKV